MFAAIAGRYDLMNRLMTVGQDQLWRRYAVRQCALPPDGWLLDVATGTGDIGYEALRMYPDLHVVGVDLTYEMLAVGQEKRGNGNLRFAGGDALALPFPGDCFDAAISGFMMRNVTDIGAAFTEQRRVVKPGGRIVCLEITHPEHPLLDLLFHIYFYRLVPLVGGIVSGNRGAYMYLPHSTTYFPPPEELKCIMEAAGLRQVIYARMGMGTVAVHVGIK